MIAVSYCDTGAIEAKDLIYQSFRRLSMLDVDGCSNMMQVDKIKSLNIYYPLLPFLGI